jgi:histone-lysine N-methyltransferase SETMAR
MDHAMVFSFIMTIAAVHTSHIVQQEIASAGFIMVPQPPYSDLSPADFWLFPKLKQELSGRHFDHISHLGRASQAVMDAIPSSEYRYAFEQWIHRLEKCIEMQGGYFQGL